VLPQLADQAREALNPNPYLQCVFQHVDPIDQELSIRAWSALCSMLDQ
jgi:hypothetical protein